MINLPDAPYPSYISYRIRTLVADQKAATQVLKTILDNARRQIETLAFPLGFPVKGYDEKEICNALIDLTPEETAELVDKWQSRATELALAP